MSAPPKFLKAWPFVPTACLPALVAALWMAASLPAAETPRGSMADGSYADRPETEIDISGPYHAWVDGEQYPASVDIWGPKATLKISIDGRDKPMVGMFVNNRLQVVYKYGAENFNLTTAVQAQYDGWNFNGQYRRIDEKLGAKIATLVLTPVWHGGGGGDGVKMPLPRRESDMSGNYSLVLTKDGQTINTQAEITMDGSTVKMRAGGREYVGDFSTKQMFPVFWQGNRMDIFQLTPTETGFQGSLQKEVGSNREVFEIEMAKGDGNGGGGHQRRWTWVYDAILANTPPVYIAKLTLHDDEARLVIDIKGDKATMIGSLADGVLAGTGKFGGTTVSIRALKNPNGFAGVFRKGNNAAVREYPIVLKNRPGRVASGPAW